MAGEVATWRGSWWQRRWLLNGLGVLMKIERRLRKRRYGRLTEAKYRVPVTTVRDPTRKHTFVGYYDRDPWCDRGRYLLCGSVDVDRMSERRGTLKPEMAVGVWDRQSQKMRKLGCTRTWNFQQGAQQQWTSGGHVAFNVEHEGQPGVRIVDLGSTEAVAEWPFHIGMVHRQRDLATSYSFYRMWHLERDYAYESAVDAAEIERIPKGEALAVRSLDTGRSVGSLSFPRLLGSHELPDQLDGKHIWVQIPKFNPSGNRVLFALRSRVAGAPEYGSGGCTDLFVYEWERDECRHVMGNREWARGTNHPVWFNDTDILLNHKAAGMNERRFTILNSHSGVHRFLFVHLDGVGHPTVDQEGRYVVTDEYMGPRGQRLIVIDRRTGRRTTACILPVDHDFRGPDRCDMHPRYNPSSGTVTIDAVRAERRVAQVLDVRSLIGKV